MTFNTDYVYTHSISRLRSILRLRPFLLAEYSHLHFNQHIMNQSDEPQMYNTSDRSIMTQVARSLFWHFSGKNSHPIQGKKASFFNFYIVLHCFLDRLHHSFVTTLALCPMLHSGRQNTSKWQVEACDLLQTLQAGQYNSCKPEPVCKWQKMLKSCKFPLGIFAIKIFTCLST